MRSLSCRRPPDVRVCFFCARAGSGEAARCAEAAGPWRTEARKQPRSTPVFASMPTNLNGCGPACSAELTVSSDGRRLAHDSLEISSLFCALFPRHLRCVHQKLDGGGASHGGILLGGGAGVRSAGDFVEQLSQLLLPEGAREEHHVSRRVPDCRSKAHSTPLRTNSYRRAAARPRFLGVDGRVCHC